MSEFILQKHRDLGAILTDTFTYIRIHYKTLGKALLLLVLPFYIISALLVGNSYSTFFTAIMSNPEADVESMMTGKFMLGMFMLLFSSGALLTATMTHIKLAYEYGEVPTSQLFEEFGSNFITLFVVYAIMVISIFFGFMFFIIPGVFIGVRLFLSPATAIIEELNPIDAIRRSWDLVQGHWWFTFAVYLVMNTISSFMSYVLIIPLTLVIGMLTTSGVAGSETVGTGIGVFYALLIVVASLFSVLLLIAMCLQYFNLVERKEGKGLRAQIEELG